MDKRRREKINPSMEFILFICNLYDDVYDDREEDTRPGGEDWEPGKTAEHLSLAAFQNELEERGIKLSTAKIRKILITGGCWTTKRSREVAELYTAAWTDYLTCHAYANMAQGEEYTAAGQTVGSDTFVFTVRYCAALADMNSTEYRITFNDGIYNIVKVDDFQFRHETLKLTAKKVMR